MHDHDNLGFDTLIAHFGEEEKIHGAVVPPIFQNSLFLFDQVEDLLDALTKNPLGPPHHYSRLTNPSVDLAEQKIARLEGTQACKLIGSGMGALSTAIMSSVEAGSHVVALDTAYQPVRTLLTNYLSHLGVTVTYVGGEDTDELLDAIRPETSVVYLEAPSSLMFRLQDVPTITRETRARGITTVFDNTYNTPLHMNPHAMGVDLVCHSCSKYLGGHSDITAGAVCGTRERIDRITKREVNLLGNILHPFQAWLLVRGMRTLSLRLKRHEATANALAAWLEERTEIERVHHISLPSFPQRDLYQSLMRGSGGLFSFEPKVQDDAKVFAFCNALKLFGRGISWGGFESLVVPQKVSPLNYQEPRWIIRLFCGLEDAEDLMRDVEGALSALNS
jgi:cystathionine gamma-lyase